MESMVRITRWWVEPYFCDSPSFLCYEFGIWRGQLRNPELNLKQLDFALRSGLLEYLGDSESADQH